MNCELPRSSMRRLTAAVESSPNPLTAEAGFQEHGARESLRAVTVMNMLRMAIDFRRHGKCAARADAHGGEIQQKLVLGQLVLNSQAEMPWDKMFIRAPVAQPGK